MDDTDEDKKYVQRIAPTLHHIRIIHAPFVEQDMPEPGVRSQLFAIRILVVLLFVVI